MLTVVTAPALTASSATSSQIGATSPVLTAFFTVVTVFVVFFTVPVPLSFSPSPFPFPFPSSFLPAPAVPLPPVVLPSLSMVISPFSGVDSRLGDFSVRGVFLQPPLSKLTSLFQINVKLVFYFTNFE